MFKNIGEIMLIMHMNDSRIGYNNTIGFCETPTTYSNKDGLILSPTSLTDQHSHYFIHFPAFLDAAKFWCCPLSLVPAPPFCSIFTFLEYCLGVVWRTRDMPITSRRFFTIMRSSSARPVVAQTRLLEMLWILRQRPASKERILFSSFPFRANASD